MGRWAGPRLLENGSGGCWITVMAEILVRWFRSRLLPARTKENKGSARAWPVAAPMLKLVSVGEKSLDGCCICVIVRKRACWSL